jgi:hypothetical protein
MFLETVPRTGSAVPLVRIVFGVMALVMVGIILFRRGTVVTKERED